jgi:hypothetical protein
MLPIFEMNSGMHAVSNIIASVCLLNCLLFSFSALCVLCTITFILLIDGINFAAACLLTDLTSGAWFDFGMLFAPNQWYDDIEDTIASGALMRTLLTRSLRRSSRAIQTKTPADCLAFRASLRQIKP